MFLGSDLTLMAPSLKRDRLRCCWWVGMESASECWEVDVALVGGISSLVASQLLCQQICWSGGRESYVSSGCRWLRLLHPPKTVSSGSLFLTNMLNVQLYQSLLCIEWRNLMFRSKEMIHLNTGKIPGTYSFIRSEQNHFFNVFKNSPNFTQNCSSCKSFGFQWSGAYMHPLT